MNRLLAVFALLMVMGAATPSLAQDYPWCVGEINQASLQCRFTSFEQCQGTAVGSGECYKNPFYVAAPGTQNSPPPMAAATPSRPQDYPWCVGDDQATLQCRFTSFEQCQGTAAGTGECYRNPFYVATAGTQNSPPPMAAAPPSRPQDYPWCVGEINQASLQCRFTSFEQCQGTAVGTGECYRNPFYVAQNSPPPVTAAQQDGSNTARKKRRGTNTN